MPQMTNDDRFELSRLRDRLSRESGKVYWRSLDEVADSPRFREFLQREFPENASEWTDTVGRRHFLKLMGASLALAGVTGCTRQPKETIWPYARSPEETVPGKPLFFATAIPLCGLTTGVLVESHMGRPTKVEGNPDHPASLGATDVLAQASVLTLYDPDRSTSILHVGEIRTWADAQAMLQGAAEGQKAGQGEGMRILTETVTSPTLAAGLRRLLAAFPKARWHQYEPAAADNVRRGAVMAFGEPVSTRYRFDRADVILALDADFVAGMPGSVRYVRHYSQRRRADDGAPMNRLYVVESTPSLSGAAADHRFPTRASEIEGIVRALAGELGIAGASDPGARDPERPSWIAAVARDLRRAGRGSLVIAGEAQPPAVHALVHSVNEALGNFGNTVIHADPLEAEPADQGTSLRELVADMEAGRVSLLLLLGGNPAYYAPADIPFVRSLDRVAVRVHLGLYNDETAALCHWHIPEAHPLESWSDARAYDGTVTILQPLVEPLYGGKTAHEILATFLGEPGLTSHDLVKNYWRTRPDAPLDFDGWWKRTLRDGIVRGTEFAEKSVAVRGIPPLNGAREEGDELEIVFRTDPHVHDGRFANNGWLQELPKPLTKLTWDNAACVGPGTAERLGLTNGDVVVLEYRGRKATAPIWILPGQSDGSVTVHLGHGRTRAGRVGNGVGFDAYALRTSDAPWFGSGVRVLKTGARHVLATTQEHHSMEGRHLVRTAALEEFRSEPEFARHLGHDPGSEMTLYSEAHEKGGHAWGMAIDLAACVGCGVCTIACQAENNIAIVGKEQVHRGREMHWMRVDRYFGGGLDNPEVHHQPVACMHCENAPCEVVCPVAATVHSSEGLNDMVYNRCVGTRYCSNNCPYKVRRFNFLLYSDWNTPSLKMLRNPDVTVRSRGVMEKCTYCVQRINYARNEAKLEDRPIRDGEIVTACQQACPADAIVFGDLNDPASRASRWKANPRNYGILTELNTKPRTTYLAGLRNPNPELGED